MRARSPLLKASSQACSACPAGVSGTEGVWVRPQATTRRKTETNLIGICLRLYYESSPPRSPKRNPYQAFAGQRSPPKPNSQSIARDRKDTRRKRLVCRMNEAETRAAQQ